MRSTTIFMFACLIALAIGGVVLFAAFRGDAGGGDSGDGAGSQVLLAAGDIAECDHQGDEATARILAEYPNATIATLGDNAYQHGTLEEFRNCYASSWGPFKDRTRPATGNHDNSTKNAQGYWDYFGARGGPYDRYYYSYDLGAWHVVVLNSDCWRGRWLRAGRPPGAVAPPRPRAASQPLHARVLAPATVQLGAARQPERHRAGAASLAGAL